MEEERKVDSEAMSSSQEKVRVRKYERVLFLILGILLGVAIKTEAYGSVTMGFDDYAVSAKDLAAYDLNAIQKEVTAKGDGAALGAQQGLRGGACGQ